MESQRNVAYIKKNKKKRNKHQHNTWWWASNGWRDEASTLV